MLFSPQLTHLLLYFCLYPRWRTLQFHSSYFQIFHIDNTDHEAELTYLSDTLSKASISDRTKVTMMCAQRLSVCKKLCST